jgi:hypothetical protein
MAGGYLQELDFGAIGHVMPNCAPIWKELASLLSGRGEDFLKPARVGPFAGWRRVQGVTLRGSDSHQLRWVSVP